MKDFISLESIPMNRRDICILWCIRYINDEVPDLTIEVALFVSITPRKSISSSRTWLMYHSAPSPPSMYLSEDMTPRPTNVDLALIVGRFRG